MRRMTDRAREVLVKAQEACRARGGHEIAIDDLISALTPAGAGWASPEEAHPGSSPDMLPFSSDLQDLLSHPEEKVLDLPELAAFAHGQRP